MNFDQLKALLCDELGFASVDTGGGCMLWEWTNGETLTLMLGQWPEPGIEDRGEPVALPAPDQPWTVSVVDHAWDLCEPRESFTCTDPSEVVDALYIYFDRLVCCHCCRQHVTLDSNYCPSCAADMGEEVSHA